MLCPAGGLVWEWEACTAEWGQKLEDLIVVFTVRIPFKQNKEDTEQNTNININVQNLLFWNHPHPSPP